METHNDNFTSHDWPKPGEHLWSKWANHGKRMVDIGEGRTAVRDHQYRSCLHPDCNAWQEREAPNG